MTIRPAFWPLPRDVYVIVARLYFVSGLTNTINIYSHTATLLCCLQQGGDKGNVVISQRIKNNLHTTVITKISANLLVRLEYCINVVYVFLIVGHVSQLVLRLNFARQSELCTDVVLGMA